MENIAKKSQAERKGFWERTRRLAHGTLVCLVVHAEGGLRLLLGTVCDRKADSLAPASGLRPQLGIRSVGGSEIGSLTSCIGHCLLSMPSAWL